MYIDEKFLYIGIRLEMQLSYLLAFPFMNVNLYFYLWALIFSYNEKVNIRPPWLSYNSNYQYLEIIHQYDSRFQISIRYLNYLISELSLLSSCSTLTQKF